MRYKKGMLIRSEFSPAVLVREVGESHYHCVCDEGFTWFVPIASAKLANPSAPISTIGKFTT